MQLQVLVIRSLGLEENAKMGFPGSGPWKQVKAHEVDTFLDKVARR